MICLEPKNSRVIASICKEYFLGLKVGKGVVKKILKYTMQSLICILFSSTAYTGNVILV